MKPLGGFWRVLLAAWCLAAPIAPCSGDTVLMHDGTMHYGEITEVTDAEVVIKTKVANIVTTLRLKRSEVVEIDRPGFEMKDGYFEKKKAIDAPGAIAAGPGQYLLVPVKGGIGDAVTARGIGGALKEARALGVRHVVFEIDTPGGAVDEAEAIVKEMENFREGAEKGAPVALHAYVRNAISAGIWVLFACDDVCWAENGTAGGAVAYHVNRSTGSAEVDAKMNSILAAERAAAAEQRGHSRHLVRAMMIPEASLHAWRTRDGRALMSDSFPPSGPDVLNPRTLDGPGSVLTLTAADALEIGFGRVVAAGPSAMGPALGVAAWESAGDSATKIMEQAARSAQRESEQKETQREKAIEILTDFRARVDELVKEAKTADGLHPLNQGPYETDRNGNFTPSSKSAWASNCRRAIEAYTALLDGVNELKRLDGRFQHLTGESLINKEGKKDFVEKVRETAAWLKAKKDATRM